MKKEALKSDLKIRRHEDKIILSFQRVARYCVKLTKLPEDNEGFIAINCSGFIEIYAKIGAKDRSVKASSRSGVFDQVVKSPPLLFGGNDKRGFFSYKKTRNSIRLFPYELFEEIEAPCYESVIDLATPYEASLEKVLKPNFSSKLEHKSCEKINHLCNAACRHAHFNKICECRNPKIFSLGHHCRDCDGYVWENKPERIIKKIAEQKDFCPCCLSIVADKKLCLCRESCKCLCCLKICDCRCYCDIDEAFKKAIRQYKPDKDSWESVGLDEVCEYPISIPYAAVFREDFFAELCYLPVHDSYPELHKLEKDLDKIDFALSAKVSNGITMVKISERLFIEFCK